MSLNELKLFSNDAIAFLKKNILGIFLSSFVIFSVIWLGNIISVITSRQILDPLSVKVEGLDAQNLSSIRVLATLSRAGNTMNLTRVLEGNKNEWDNPSQTFVKKILVGFNNGSLSQLSQITVTLGQRDFVYTKKQFLDNWNKINKKDDSWYMSGINDSSGYFVYEAPDNIKVKPWNLRAPIISSLLSSINFRGSEYLVYAPLVSSFKTFLLVFVIFIVIFFIFSYFWRKHNKVYNDNNDFYKIEFITFTLGILATSGSIFLLCVCIKFFYRPDTSKIVFEASKIYLDKLLPAFIPKPVERLQFALSVLSSPFLLFTFYKLFSKYINTLSKEIIPRVYSIISTIVLLLLFSVTYIGLSVSNFMYVEKSYFFNGVGKYLYSLVLFPLGVYIIFSLKKEKYYNLINILLYIFSGVLLMSMFFVSIIGVGESNLDMLSIVSHANPIFFPISQVVAGKTLLVNLSSQYGLYPVFLEPIFKLFGLNMLSLTSTMGVLLSLSFLFIFLFIHRLVKNKIILFLGFSTIMFYFLDGSASPYPYFQYWPIRTLFPSILLFLSSLYFKSKNKFLYYLLFFISALAILWNFDSGIIVFSSWIIALFYMEMFKSDIKIIIRNIIFHVIRGALAICLVSSGYVVYSFLRSGQMPNLSLFFLYQKLFYDGFMMIAMPFPHIWILIMLIFLSGLLWSIRNLIIKDDNYKNISIFLLSILGIGLFSYYEGRSHDATLYTPLYLVLMLLPIMADNIFDILVKNSKLYGHTLLFLFIIFILFASPLSIIHNSHRYFSSVKAGFNSFSNHSETTLSNNVNFIKRNTKEWEGVIMLTGPFDGAYFGETHTRSILDIPSFTEVFYKREADYIINFLRCNKTVKVFVYPFSKFYDQFGNDLVDIRINQLIKSNYSVVTESGDDMVVMMNNYNNSGGCFYTNISKLIIK